MGDGEFCLGRGRWKERVGLGWWSAVVVVVVVVVVMVVVVVVGLCLG